MDEATVITAAIRHLRDSFGISYRPIVAIVSAMALDEKRSFELGLKLWTEWDAECGRFAWPASRWRSEICYRLLKAGQEAPGGLEAWMQARAKEVRRIANESE